MKRIAFFYGQGATYDAIEVSPLVVPGQLWYSFTDCPQGRFRKAKKDALALKDEAEGRSEPKSRTDKSAFAASTPKKSRTTANPDSVKAGRVTKATPKNPSRTTKSKSYVESDDEDEADKVDSDSECGVKMEDVEPVDEEA